MLLLALGLPLAMALSWYHGDRVSRRMSAGEFSILSVLLVCASILFYAFVRPSPETTTAAAPLCDGDRLKDIVKEGKTSREPVEFIIKNGDRYRTVKIDYHGGLRYPHLEATGGATLLDSILADRN